MKNRKNVSLLQIVIFLAIFIIGCENKNDQPDMNFTYPLTIGNKWEYTRMTTLDYDSLANSNGLTDTTFYGTDMIEIITKEIIFDSLEVYNFAETLIESNNVFTSNEYYNNSDSCLISYGYTHGSIGMPKTNDNQGFIIFDKKKFNNMREVFNYLEKGISMNRLKLLTMTVCLLTSFQILSQDISSFPGG